MRRHPCALTAGVISRTRIDFDEIRATPGHVILVGHVRKDGAFASLFTVEDEGRITSVQDFEDVEALEATLV
jgi:hypothetical protein